MALRSRLLRTRTPNSRLRDHVRPPVVYGALVQGVAMIAFAAVDPGMRPAVFAVGTSGPLIAALLTAPDAGWVDAPLAGVGGGCVYLLALLAYGAYVASQFDYVTATWVFGDYVALAVSHGIMLLPAFAFFGLFVGGAVGYAKRVRRRR